MKTDLPKPLIFAVIAAAVVLLGFVIFKAMSTPLGDQPTKEDEKALYEAAVNQERIANGGPRDGGEAAARGR
jgi:hypothetical protein